MSFKMYKMHFSSVHFGNGHLDTSETTFTASRLFSALFLEAIKLGEADNFLTLAMDDKFGLSDSLLMVDEQPFLPKPIMKIDFADNDDLKQMRKDAKAAKKLHFVSEDNFDDYISGEFTYVQDLRDQETFQDYKKEESNTQISSVTRVGQYLDQSDPYQVGVATFNTGVDLYVIASQSDLFDHLMEALQFTGLGGKRSTGYGQFQLEIRDFDFSNRITLDAQKKVMSLTSALPIDTELEKVMASGEYKIRRNAGYAFSAETAANHRKREIYTFEAGSTFKETWRGSIVDVSPAGLLHPVWHYAKPLFFELEG